MNTSTDALSLLLDLHRREREIRRAAEAADWNERGLPNWLRARQVLRSSTTLTAYQARVLALIPGNGEETDQHIVAAQIERGPSATHDAGRATKTAVTKAFKAIYAKGHVQRPKHSWGGCTYTVQRIVSSDSYTA